MVGSQCSDNMELKKGPWTPEEDEVLIAYVQEHGHGSWRTVPSKAGLRRCGKSCRLRWTNYLRPDINRGKFSLQEEQTIFQLHALLGNRWSSIATHLPNRTDNQIKNYWNTHLKKRLTKMGIDPITHKPKDNTSQSKEVANISHLAQWESARLQAEARLVSSPYPLLNTVRAGPALPLPLSRPPCLDILKVWEWTNPGKNISSLILNGFSPENQRWSHMQAISCAAPAENMLPNTAVGLADENSGASSVAKPNYNNHQEEAEGIMDNSVEMDHDSTSVDDSLGFPSFIDGFTDHLQPNLVSATGNSDNTLGDCLGVLEENRIWAMD